MSLALLGIGIFIGAMIDEDAKGKVIDDLRKTAIKLLSKPDEKERIVRENYNQKKQISHCDYLKRYEEHRKKQDEQDRIVTDEEILNRKVKLLRFKTFEEAAQFKSEMLMFAKENGNRLTMCDLGKMRGEAVPYTWDNYGWDYNEIDDARIVNYTDCSNIIIYRPKIFDMSKE